MEILYLVKVAEMLKSIGKDIEKIKDEEGLS